MLLPGTIIQTERIGEVQRKWLIDWQAKILVHILWQFKLNSSSLTDLSTEVAAIIIVVVVAVVMVAVACGQQKDEMINSFNRS